MSFSDFFGSFGDGKYVKVQLTKNEKLQNELQDQIDALSANRAANVQDIADFSAGVKANVPRAYAEQLKGAEMLNQLNQRRAAYDPLTNFRGVADILTNVAQQGVIDPSVQRSAKLNLALSGLAPSRAGVSTNRAFGGTYQQRVSDAAASDLATRISPALFQSIGGSYSDAERSLFNTNLALENSIASGAAYKPLFDINAQLLTPIKARSGLAREDANVLQLQSAIDNLNNMYGTKYDRSTWERVGSAIQALDDQAKTDVSFAVDTVGSLANSYSQLMGGGMMGGGGGGGGMLGSMYGNKSGGGTAASFGGGTGGASGAYPTSPQSSPYQSFPQYQPPAYNPYAAPSTGYVAPQSPYFNQYFGNSNIA